MKRCPLRHLKLLYFYHSPLKLRVSVRKLQMMGNALLKGLKNAHQRFCEIYPPSHHFVGFTSPSRGHHALHALYIVQSGTRQNQVHDTNIILGSPYLI